MGSAVHIPDLTVANVGRTVHRLVMSTFADAASSASGLFAYRQLVDQGFSDAEIRGARAAGTLVRVYRGLYAPGLPDPGSRRPLDVLRILGVAGESPTMAVSHASAAVLHNIPLWKVDPAIVHLTRSARGGSVRSPRRMVHSAQTTAGELTTVRGVLVTSVARTLVDLSRTHTFESAVIACDHALANELVKPAELLTAMDRARHRPGNAKARRAVGFADGRAESPGESRTRVLMHRLGLEPPDLQIEVFDHNETFLGRTDLGYHREAVLIEFDGAIKYGKLLRDGQRPSDVVVKEKLREDRMRAVGASVLRLVWSDLDQPQSVLRRIAEVRRQGRALIAAGATSGRFRPRPARRVTATDAT